MNEDEFVSWLDAMVATGRIDRNQADDVRHQRAIFDEVRDGLEEAYLLGNGVSPDVGQLAHGGVVVGYQQGERLIADTVPELLAQAQERSDYWLVYFEPVGYNPFGSA